MSVDDTCGRHYWHVLTRVLFWEGADTSRPDVMLSSRNLDDCCLRTISGCPAEKCARFAGFIFFTVGIVNRRDMLSFYCRSLFFFTSYFSLDHFTLVIVVKFSVYLRVKRLTPKFEFTLSRTKSGVSADSSFSALDANCLTYTEFS